MVKEWNRFFSNLSDDKCSHVTGLPVADMEERREDSCGKLLKSLWTIQSIVYSLGAPPVLGCWKKQKKKHQLGPCQNSNKIIQTLIERRTTNSLEKRWVVLCDINIANLFVFFKEILNFETWRHMWTEIHRIQLFREKLSFVEKLTQQCRKLLWVMVFLRLLD